MPFLRKYGTGTGSNVAIPMVKAASSDYATGSDWTPASGDVKVSKDGGSQANIATLPSYSNGDWVFVFSDAELQCKRLSVRIVDSATKAVEDSGFNVETYGNASAMLVQDLSAATYAANVTALDGDENAPQDLAAMTAAFVGNSNKMPSVDGSGAALATATALATVAGYIDTEVAAIKAKTDQLTFTVANKVDSTPTHGALTSLAAMISANKFTADALSNAPTGGDEESFTEEDRTQLGEIFNLVQSR